MAPLDGILVADFSRVLAGPLAAMLLGDLGADVVKVERPDGGDDTRAWGPPWRDGHATYYLGLNRNKRSLALDLGDPGDVELARRLAGRADVLIESFRPGLMARWGLDGDTLRAENPGLVTCSVTAFGTGEAAPPTARLRLAPQAIGGLMHVTGEADGPPVKTGAAVIDLVCGLLAVVGIRRRSPSARTRGPGADFEVTLMDAALVSLLNQGSAGCTSGVVPDPRGNRHPSITPYETFATQDRPIAVASATTGCSRGCATSSAWPELPGTRASRPTARASRTADEVSGAAAPPCSHAPGRRWIDRAERGGRAGGPDQRRPGRTRTPSSSASSRWARSGGLPTAAPPLRVDGERPPIRRPPPALDEHGDRATRIAQPALASRLADHLRQHEAHVLAQHLEAPTRRRAARRGRSRRAAATSSSGALAPEEMPTTRSPSSHSSRTWSRCRSGRTPRRDRARRRRAGCEFDEFCEPTTSTRSHSPAICLTAAWRFVVA